MRKGLFILTIALMLSGMSVAADSDLGVDVDLTWVSKYIWRGIDLYDDKAAFQPSATFDLGEGFSANIWWSTAGSSGGGGTSTVDGEELDYSLTYANTVNEGDQTQMDYALSWVYYDYPDAPSKDTDAQEFNLVLTWPQLCTFGVTPMYQVIYGWPSKSGGANRETAGFVHVFGMNYDFELEGLEQPLNFMAAAVYNDGTYGASVDHDWSHILWGLSTSFTCPATGGTFTPAIYYQTSMDDSVNPEDEFWTGISYSYSF